MSENAGEQTEAQRQVSGLVKSVRYQIMNHRATLVAGPCDTLRDAKAAYQDYDMSPSCDYYIVREEREVIE
jgi:hypothetical protein